MTEVMLWAGTTRQTVESGWKGLWTTDVPPVPTSPIPATRDALHCVTLQLPRISSFLHFTQIFLYCWAENHLLWGSDRINKALHNAHIISVSSPQLMVYFLLIQFKHLPKNFKLFLWLPALATDNSRATENFLLLSNNPDHCWETNQQVFNPPWDFLRFACWRSVIKGLWWAYMA